FSIHALLPTSTSTLFPYTTLFRSLRSAQGRLSAVHASPNPRSNAQYSYNPEMYSPQVLDHFEHPRNTGEVDAKSGREPGANTFRDRKSTRLNSSHGSISYAVFCLK